MNNELIASHTSGASKTFELWVMGGAIKIVEGVNTTKGWMHKKTTVYANVALAKAAFTKRAGVAPQITI